jgi:hypothetical protein
MDAGRTGDFNDYVAPPAQTTEEPPAAPKPNSFVDKAKGAWNSTSNATKIGVLVILVVLVVAIVAWFADRGRRENLKTTLPMAEKLIRVSSKWGVASAQDQSPLLALEHANYAVAYARAAREVASEADIAKKLHVDLPELIAELTEVQDRAVRKMSRACPSLVPDVGPVSVATGWIA